MLEGLERVRKTADAGDWAWTEDVFAFRDWCLGAPGRGNLLLAIAAEETAASLLFRALAEDQTRGDEVRRRFVRCLPNGLSADYWLATLDMEGIAVDCGDALKPSDPEYIRMGTVLQTLFAQQGGWGNPLSGPKGDGTWNGCTDAFAPGQLVFRTMLVARKEIALKTCLDILAWTGAIPEERTAFIDAADKYASKTLRKRHRFTSWAIASEVWDCWEKALAEARGMKNKPRLGNRSRAATDVSPSRCKTSDSVAGEAGTVFLQANNLEEFVLLSRMRGIAPSSISDAGCVGAGGAERLGWGQTMLEDLERVQKTADAGDWARTEEVFAFRDWCLGAFGRGNLLLAIAAEDTAATLLFRSLAEDQTREDEVRRRFAYCLPNGLTADYWLETLAMEGIVTEGIAAAFSDAFEASDPEYHRMEMVLEMLVPMLGGWPPPLRFSGPWKGCADEFDPVQLAMRTAKTIKTEIAPEVCLKILDGAGIIPEERSAFIDAAHQYAEGTLHNRNRAMGRVTPEDVWDYWAAALAEVRKDGRERELSQ